MGGAACLEGDDATLCARVWEEHVSERSKGEKYLTFLVLVFKYGRFELISNGVVQPPEYCAIICHIYNSTCPRCLHPPSCGRYRDSSWGVLSYWLDMLYRSLASRDGILAIILEVLLAGVLDVLLCVLLAFLLAVILAVQTY